VTAKAARMGGVKAARRSQSLLWNWGPASRVRVWMAEMALTVFSKVFMGRIIDYSYRKIKDFL
jgi:hypothetical protein